MAAERWDANIWIAFGMGKHFHFISVNRVCVSLGQTRARCLPVFHALSGCDTTSAFVGKGKQSALQAWQLYNEVNPTLVSLLRTPTSIWMLTRRISGRLREWQSLCMTRLALMTPSMKQERNCFVSITDKWISYLLQR